jgi:Flp pilus assembly protein TadG
MLTRGSAAGVANPARQRGAVMILFVAGMVAIIGIAGLALDGGHAMLSKTRLQNSVDAAALSAAKTLDETADTALAEAAALTMLGDNANNAGNRELGEAFGSGSLAVSVEFSSTLSPFVPGTVPAEYVRVRAENFALPVWFSVVLGITEKSVAASAVAGPSPTINQACNIMPMMVCGDPAAGPPYWGYAPGQPDVLKSSTPSGDWDVGPGNFQLIRLGDGQGGADVREAMAGSFDGCLAGGDVVETEPGNTIGPVVQGLNTRFGRYLGPMSGMQSTYPPDVVTRQPTPALDYDSDTDQITQNGQAITDGSEIDFGYDDYVARVESSSFDYQPSPAGIGAYQRREAAVAIGDCSETTNGQGEIPLLGFGCFFLLQEAAQQGNESYVYGEFIEECRAGGMPGPAPTTVPGPYVIQLYRDFASTDS